MKSIVIYYSLEGHTKRIAEWFAEEMHADLIELKPVKDIPKKGFRKYLLGGKSAVFKSKPKLVDSLPSLEDYDTIVIGTPIWAGTYAPAIRTLLAEIMIQKKRIALFACHKGGGAGKGFEQLEEQLKGNKILGSMSFIEPSKEEEEMIRKEIRHWVRHM